MKSTKLVLARVEEIRKAKRPEWDLETLAVADLVLRSKISVREATQLAEKGWIEKI